MISYFPFCMPLFALILMVVVFSVVKVMGKQQICLFSQSEQISKLVLFYPALCIPDDARRGKMMLAEFDPKNIPEIVKCGPMILGRCYVADVIEMNPFEIIKNYAKDVLIVHGTADRIVDIKYAEQAAETYRKGNAEPHLQGPP